jgi:hypothetical protein
VFAVERELSPRFRRAAIGRGRGRALLAAGVLVVTALAVALAPPARASYASPRPAEVIQRPVHSAAPDAAIVKESYVKIYSPLSAAIGPHPKACDWIGFLRFRHTTGPANPSDADAVFVSMPGIFAGAASFDQVARHVVRRAALGGRDVEFWGLDRRSNCLEDHRGVNAAAKAHDPSVAFGYYWRGRTVGGHRFGGFKDAQETAFQRNIGLARTMRDWFRVLRRMIPSRQVRRHKVLCGGHSLGGPLTTAFAGWDLDDDRNTRDDAGYNQCAGFFGFDTSLGFDPGGPSHVGGEMAIAQASGASPYLNAPPFTPETIEIPGVYGVGAYFHPNSTAMLDETPHSPNIDLSERTLFSRDAANFATGMPSIRDFNITNEAAMAGIFDDNSDPVTILRASLGTTAGGDVAQKNFPTPGEAGAFAPLVNNRLLAIPSEPNGPVYRWRNYDQLRGDAKQKNDAGERYTSWRNEFSDAHQFARSLFEAPADFAEQYFPTRLVSDISDAEGGDRSGSLRHLRYNGINRRPAFLITAGDSGENTGAHPDQSVDSTAPNDLPLSGAVTLPGYNHLDVVAAAWGQNNGRPERSSRNLLGFGLRVLGLR